MNRWRLPTIQELLSIVDYTKYNPATNLEGIKSARYWSSSPYVSDSLGAWAVSFCSGDSYHCHKNRSYYVRCVRTLNDVTLEWANEDAPKEMTWQEAMDYAESLNKKTIVLETWLIESALFGGFTVVEGTKEFYEGRTKIKLLSTREVEI